MRFMILYGQLGAGKLTTITYNFILLMRFSNLKLVLNTWTKSYLFKW